jgi:hypothetical protein
MVCRPSAPSSQYGFFRSLGKINAADLYQMLEDASVIIVISCPKSGFGRGELEEIEADHSRIDTGFHSIPDDSIVVVGLDCEHVVCFFVVGG